MAKEITVGINSARILKALWNYKIMSRVDLARHLGINKSTVSKQVNDLISTNIIQVVSEGDSSPIGGRKPFYISLNPDFGAVLGVELQTDFYTVVIVNLQGEIIFQNKEDMAVGNKTVAQLFMEIYTSLLPKIKDLKLKIIGAAIGVAGLVNPYKGYVYQSNPLNITDTQDVYSELDSLLDFPVLIENDANCGAWGELAYSKETMVAKDFIYILGETRINKIANGNFKGVAIGIGIVIDNKVHYGEDFSAGEFQSVFRTGEYSNQFAISDEEAERYEESEELFDRIANELSKNIALIVNILNLKEVILGGRIEYHPEMIRVMEKEINRNWSYDKPVKVRIRFSDLKELTVAHGAAAMFLEQFFSLPDVSASKSHIEANTLRERSARTTSFIMETL